MGRAVCMAGIQVTCMDRPKSCESCSGIACQTYRQGRLRENVERAKKRLSVHRQMLPKEIAEDIEGMLKFIEEVLDDLC